LLDRIRNSGFLSEETAAKYFLQLVMAVNFCHSHMICHRDLKPENFIFSSPETDSFIKLIDFGLSKQFYEFDEIGDGKVLRMQTKAGTSYYMAPEVLNENYSEKCDYWSLGVLLFLMLGGYPPFEGENDEEILESVKRMEYTFDDPSWYNVSDEAKDLISHLLVPESERYTIPQILKHPWIKTHNSTDHNIVNMKSMEIIQL
jgi:calcium-dependent protein kinase